MLIFPRIPWIFDSNSFFYGQWIASWNLGNSSKINQIWPTTIIIVVLLLKLPADSTQYLSPTLKRSFSPTSTMIQLSSPCFEGIVIVI